MNNKSSKQILYGVIAGYLATSFTVVLIPIILIKPESRSDFFWFRIGWVELLTFLTWSVLGYQLIIILRPNQIKGSITGILPTIFLSVIIYSILSFGLIILSSYLPENSFVQRWHIVGQICLAFLLIVLVVSLYFSNIGAARTPDDSSPSISNPEKLVLLLKSTEERLNNLVIDYSQSHLTEVIRHVKLLREKLYYSNLNNAIAENRVEYLELENDIRSLLKETENIFLGDFDSTIVSNLVNKTKLICTKANSLAQAATQSGSV